jgi:hypothetical protein
LVSRNLFKALPNAIRKNTGKMLSKMGGIVML